MGQYDFEYNFSICSKVEIIIFIDGVFLTIDKLHRNYIEFIIYEVYFLKVDHQCISATIENTIHECFTKDFASIF